MKKLRKTRSVQESNPNQRDSGFQPQEAFGYKVSYHFHLHGDSQYWCFTFYEKELYAKFENKISAKKKGINIPSYYQQINLIVIFFIVRILKLVS